jgi:3',5'-nucleoside bisphosphate phosphatase
MIDLHCHSTASDGTLTPAELMVKARESGVNYIALTDHDTVDGIIEAEKTASGLNINLVKGIEISCNLDSGELHIVGLFVDIKNEALTGLCSELIKFRLERNIRLYDKFHSIGIDIDKSLLLENGKDMGKLGKPNFARYLYRKGYVKHEKEAYSLYLNRGGLADVAKEKIDDYTAINVIHEAGGISILAHPDQTNIFNFSDFKKFISGLKSRGLDGIEVYYTNYNKKQIKFYKNIANVHDLLISGGSDYHGPASRNASLGFYGKKKMIPPELINAMKDHLFRMAR